MTTQDYSELDHLLQAAGRGDESAFRRFYELCSPKVMAFLLNMLRDRFQAEDVLQDAMVVAWQKSNQFDPSRAAATTWITMIARRRALDILRGQSRRDEILRDDADGVRGVLGLQDEQAEPVTQFSTTDKRLVTCLGDLSEDAADCIRFAYLEGLSFPEVAERIDRSLGTVKSWIRRGMSKLRECMQQ